MPTTTTDSRTVRAAFAHRGPRCRRFTLATGALALAAIWPAQAAFARGATLELNTGETLTGEFVSQDDASVTILHPVLGELTVQREQIASANIEPPAPDAAAAEGSSASGAQPDQGVEDEAASVWDLTFGLGLNGSRGSSDSDNLRTNFNAERFTESMETTLDITYTLEREEGDNTDNRFDAVGRNEWLVPDSKWRYYVQGRWEIDQFESYDQRYRLGGGVGYEFIMNDTHRLIGRTGLGVVQEQGGERDGETGLEAIFALDYEWTINDRSSFKAKTEWAPDLTEGGKVRARSTAAYEIALNEDGSLNLQLGVEHRFDKFESDNKNEFDYFALIAYSF